MAAMKVHKPESSTMMKDTEELRSLSDDILMQILSRLSTKDLNSLKFVAKALNNLISDRSLICHQLKKTEGVSGFFLQARFRWCQEDFSRISYIPLETRKARVHSNLLNFLPEEVVILASCNGLLCCRSSNPSSRPFMYVCNPLNKQYVRLDCDHYSRNASVALVFDPLNLPTEDVPTTFKIVTVSQAESETEESEFTFHIYSSETGGWRESREKCYCNQDLSKKHGIFADGSFYWLTDDDKVLMFNLETELYWLINGPLPAEEFHTIPEMCIGESKGKLHCVVLSEHGLQLWSLQDFLTPLWNMAFSVPLEEFEEENYRYVCGIAETLAPNFPVRWIRFLAFKHGIFFLRVGSSFYSYDFSTRKLSNLCDNSDLGPYSKDFPMVVPYTMSLAPL